MYEKFRQEGKIFFTIYKRLLQNYWPEKLFHNLATMENFLAFLLSSKLVSVKEKKKCVFLWGEWLVCSDRIAKHVLAFPSLLSNANVLQWKVYTCFTTEQVVVLRSCFGRKCLRRHQKQNNKINLMSETENWDEIIKSSTLGETVENF